MHGLSCSVSCGIFPDQGLNPRSVRWQVILNHWATREVPISVLLKGRISVMNQKKVERNPTFQRSVLSYPIPQIIITILRLSLSLLHIFPSALPPYTHPPLLASLQWNWSQKEPKTSPQPILTSIFDCFPLLSSRPIFFLLSVLASCISFSFKCISLEMTLQCGVLFSFPDLLRHNWQIKFHIFKVHKMMIWYICTL